MPTRGLLLSLFGAVLLFLSGCTDENAQKSIDGLNSQNQALATRVAELEKQIKNLQGSVNYDDVIENKVNAKITAIQADSRKKGEDDTKSIRDFVDSSRKAIEDMNEAMHAQIGDRDKAGVIEEHLQNRIAAQAELDKTEREKMKADILLYIDSQLKDMYPFAFKKQRANEPRKISDQVDIP